MLEFFEIVGNWLNSVGNWFVEQVTQVSTLIRMLSLLVAQLPTVFSWLPEEILAYVVVAFSLVVLYKVLGRE